ncbi:unnamed protein product [Clonostachys rosea]|uniref:Zn(2)-C6 fungal-type domain-containing protein n=1 Tax=Bionectria ochroleuca TaxID=29856 RepID=A0ABY6TTT0_BIOOC|nr:unnamed protein product [Clonostachys rosea]
MTGVRRSQRCQNCRARKIKCDQNWPRCGHCQRTNRICSGPSPLTKFVDQSRGLPSKSDINSKSQTTPMGSGSGAESAILVNHHPLKPFNDGSASYGVFRLEAPCLEVPRARLTTSADRVSARLAGLLERGSEAGVRIQMSYLPLLPQRLSRSACLRDCTGLFCYAWNGYRRREPVSKLLLTSHYNKAIRSLQLAINGGQAYDVETFGAMVLLERASSLFGEGQPQSALAHRRAIRHVLQAKRGPAIGDELDVSLTYENQWLKVKNPSIGRDEFHFIDTISKALPAVTQPSDSDVSLDPGWLEVIENFQSEPPTTEEFSCFSGESASIKEASGKMISWVGDIGQILSSPATMKDLKETLVQDLSHHSQVLEAVTVRVLNRGLIQGSIIELPNLAFFTGRKYEFASVALAHHFAGLLAVRRGILRIINDLIALYGPPDESILENFRELSIQQWMVFPYLSQMNAVSHHFLTPCMKPSLEVASGFETEFLVNLLSSANRHNDELESKGGS